MTTTYTSLAGTTGFCTIKATESNAAGTGTIFVDQTSSPAPALGSLTYTSANPGPLVVNTAGSSTSSGVVSVKAVDASSTPLSGDAVQFTLTPSVAGACGTVSPAPATTSSAGTASVTYVAGTAAGTCTLVGTEADTGAVTPNLVIVQTAVPESITLTAGSTTVPVGTQTTITATVKNDRDVS